MVMVKEKGTHTVMTMCPAYVRICVFLSVSFNAVVCPQCLQMCPVVLLCHVAFGFRSALIEFVAYDLIFLNV